jgi:hypothetical protein
MKKKQIIARESEPNILEFEGRKFRLKREKGKIVDHHFHGDKVVFEEVDEQEHAKNIKYVVDKVKKAISIEDILTEIFKQMSMDDVKGIKNKLIRKKKVRKSAGCVGVLIGEGRDSEYVCLID